MNLKQDSNFEFGSLAGFAGSLAGFAGNFADSVEQIHQTFILLLTERKLPYYMVVAPIRSWTDIIEFALLC